MAALRPNCSFSSQTVRCPESISLHSVQTPSTARICNRGTRRRRRRELLSVILLGAGLPSLIHVDSSVSFASDERPLFYDLEDSNDGVKALDIREGSGRSPRPGDKVEIHYYARLAAKQGWRFDSTYDHKDGTGAPVPYVFTIGSGTVIEGLDLAVQTMKEGGVRRVIIPPSKGYQNTSQGPIPPNIFDRQRLYTTIFNPTRLANGEGSTLGTLIFDIELLGVRPRTDKE